MKTTEKIKVFVKLNKEGKTICICHASLKGCGDNCQRDEVTRDRFNDWFETMKRDRYGK